MRLLAIGDIHGCHTALRALEAAVPLAPDDLLVTLGDYVDRGPDSPAVLDWLIARQATGRLIALLGNHERMMLDARLNPRAQHAWLLYGGDATLKSYAARGATALLSDIPAAHWHFLETDCQTWFDTESHFFVHANVLPNIPLDEQPDAIVLWRRFHDVAPHEGGKIMICGHTPQPSGHPKNLGYAVCIDTGACNAGWLTCLDVQSGTYWQANERGEVRRDQLPAANASSSESEHVPP